MGAKKTSNELSSNESEKEERGGKKKGRKYKQTARDLKPNQQAMTTLWVNIDGHDKYGGRKKMADGTAGENFKFQGKKRCRAQLECPPPWISGGGGGTARGKPLLGRGFQTSKSLKKSPLRPTSTSGSRQFKMAK